MSDHDNQQVDEAYTGVHVGGILEGVHVGGIRGGILERGALEGNIRGGI